MWRAVVVGKMWRNAWCAMAGGGGIAKTYAARATLSTVTARENTCIHAGGSGFGYSRAALDLDSSVRWGSLVVVPQPES